jgi:hypothetical protein
MLKTITPENFIALFQQWRNDCTICVIVTNEKSSSVVK